jgi:hypothetical protein
VNVLPADVAHAEVAALCVDPEERAHAGAFPFDAVPLARFTTILSLSHVVYLPARVVG